MISVFVISPVWKTSTHLFRTANQADKDGNFLYTQNIVQLNPAIFSWLDLLDMNVIVVIVLMLAVSGFCIISGLLILILEGIPFIGVMKALGADNRYIRRIFLWQAAFLIGSGMVAGNGLGLILCALQYFFHIVPLDPSAYYVSYVPIVFNWTWWAVLNIGTFMVSMLILLAPSAIITPSHRTKYEVWVREWGDEEMRRWKWEMNRWGVDGRALTENINYVIITIMHLTTPVHIAHARRKRYNQADSIIAPACRQYCRQTEAHCFQVTANSFGNALYR